MRSILNFHPVNIYQFLTNTVQGVYNLGRLTFSKSFTVYVEASVKVRYISSLKKLFFFEDVSCPNSFTRLFTIKIFLVNDLKQKYFQSDFLLSKYFFKTFFYQDVSCREETIILPKVLQMRHQWYKSQKESMRLAEAGMTNEVLDSAFSSLILVIWFIMITVIVISRNRYSKA